VQEIYFINKPVKKLMKWLDDQIQERKDKLTIEIVSEAGLKGHSRINKDLYDIDIFKSDVERFIKKRL
jgi:hypothetical protein